MKSYLQWIKDRWIYRNYTKYVCTRHVTDSVTDTIIARKGDIIYIKKASGSWKPGATYNGNYTFKVRLNTGESFEMLAADLAGFIRPSK